MSTNIDSVHYVGEGRLSINGLDLHRLLGKYRNDLPESNFLDDIATEEGPNKVYTIERFRWCGEGSGHAYYDVLHEVLGCTTGKAGLVFVWEGGRAVDSFTGVTVDNGIIRPAKVKFVLETMWV